jgi:hypothetical protein
MVTNGNELVPLDRIRLDGGTQTRVEIDKDTVKEYAEAYQAGEQLPPVVLFNDGECLWMADGFHRFGGAKFAGRTDIEAEVRQGTARDALLHSAGCNGAHGLRRSNEDKRRAVELLLAVEEWADKSNTWIAEQCRVSDKLVAAVRDDRSSRSVSSSRNTPRRTGRDGRTYKAQKPRRASNKPPTHKPQADAGRAETVQEEMQRVSAAIESFCRKVMALVEEEMPHDPWLDHDNRRNGALQKFKDACSTLRSVKCTHICPVCQGTKKDANDDRKPCTPCLGTGRMPKAFYDQAV